MGAAPSSSMFAGKRDRHRSGSASHGDGTARSANPEMLTNGVGNVRDRKGGAPRQTAGPPKPSGRIFGDSGVDLGQPPDVFAITTPLSRKVDLSPPELAIAILSRHHRKLIGGASIGS